MWQPNRRQWLVLWIAAPLAWLAWALPGTDSLEDVLAQAWVLVVAVAALLLWRFADPPAAPSARGAKPRDPPPPLRVLAWLLVLGLLAGILVRLGALRSAVGDLLQPSDLNDVQSTLQDIADKLSK